jgi:SAM-dependent methyltransferase
MTRPDPRSAPNKIAEAAMDRHRAIILNTTVNDDYAYQSEQLIEDSVIWLSEHCKKILDIGQSTRQHARHFKSGQCETMDVNAGDNPPDIIDDICAPSRLKKNDYDAIVCLSVLEHVYDPFAANQRIWDCLKPGGYLFLHLPFLFRYHAPSDLAFADGYRFSRDGMAWLLKDYSDVTLYSIRGPYSSIFNLHRFWKKRIEKYIGTGASRWVDRFGSVFGGRPTSHLQVSGYYAFAQKPL